MREKFKVLTCETCGATATITWSDYLKSFGGLITFNTQIRCCRRPYFLWEAGLTVLLEAA